MASRACASVPSTHPNSTWLNSKDLYPLWREAERLGAVFNFYILPQQMPMLEDMAGRFPGVKIVVDHLGKPDLKAADPWADFRKMFRLKRFPQVWISASEPYEISLTKQFPYRDTYPFYKATYEEFGAKKLIWGTGYPKPRWELPMDKELEFVNSVLRLLHSRGPRTDSGKKCTPHLEIPEGERIVSRKMLVEVHRQDVIGAKLDNEAQDADNAPATRSLSRRDDHRQQFLACEWKRIGLHAAGMRCLLDDAGQIGFGDSPGAQRGDVEIARKARAPSRRHPPRLLHSGR